jgi:lipopolysaccharide transport system ATP-binding protein
MYFSSACDRDLPMSSDPFVQLRGLGKKYTLYDRPWEHLADVLFGMAGGRDFWALRNVDLDLRKGDCVGIVGVNGAGKSTLLELICGLSRPSEGTLETRGRIAALLQLGAGFNPEFTGRENVMLTGSIYGLSTNEIEQRFAAIESFAGIGDFIDKPVREYSSGMYARLAFSVCAHVDADILVVDEILGVGDVRFQQNSMRYLRRFRQKGIVLFVSHDEHAVAALCNRAIWIEKGRVMAAGATKDVLYRYRREMSRQMLPGSEFIAIDAAVDPEFDTAEAQRPTSDVFDPDDPPEPNGGGRVRHVALTGRGGPLHAASGGEKIRLSVSFSVERARGEPRVVFAVRNPMGQIIFGGDSRDGGGGEPRGDDESTRMQCAFTLLLPHLPTGNYPIDVFLLCDDAGATVCLDRHEAAAVVQVFSTHVSSGMANVRLERALLLVGDEVVLHES